MRRNPTGSILTAVLLALALVATACGGDDSGGGSTASEPSAVEAALAAKIGEDTDMPGMNADIASCVAAEIVRVMGEDHLAELGVTADNVPALEDIGMDAADVGIVLGGYNACLDMVDVFTQGMAQDVGDEKAKCMADALGGTVINEMFRANLANDQAAVNRTQDAMGIAASACGLS